jgi:hypothetical protein
MGARGETDARPWKRSWRASAEDSEELLTAEQAARAPERERRLDVHTRRRVPFTRRLSRKSLKFSKPGLLK